MNKRNILTRIGFSFSGSIFNQVSNLLSGILLMRSLSVEAFGIYAYVYELVTILAFVSDGGVSQFLVKKYANEGLKDHEKNQGFQLIVSISIFIISFLVSLSSHDVNIVKYAFILMIGYFVNSFLNQIHLYLLAQGQLKSLFVKDVTLSLIRIIFFLIGFYCHLSVSYFLFAQFALAASTIFLWLCVKKKLSISFIFSINIDKIYIFELLKKSGFLICLNVLYFFYMRLDLIMIKQLQGFEMVGLYSGATRFFFPLLIVSSSLYQAFCSILVKSQENIALSQLQNRLIVLHFLIGMAIAIFFYFFSDVLFSSLFGVKYAQSIQYFKVLVWVLPSLLVLESVNAYFITQGRYKYLFTVIILMVLIKILLNYMLVPELNVLGNIYSFAIATYCILLMHQVKLYKRGIRFINIMVGLLIFLIVFAYWKL